jgi:hypothetical protein
LAFIRTADGPGDVDAEFDAGETGAGGGRGHGRQARATSAEDAVGGDPVELDRGQIFGQFQYKPRNSGIGY